MNRMIIRPDGTVEKQDDERSEIMEEIREELDPRLEEVVPS